MIKAIFSSTFIDEQNNLLNLSSNRSLSIYFKVPKTFAGNVCFSIPIFLATSFSLYRGEGGVKKSIFTLTSYVDDPLSSPRKQRVCPSHALLQAWHTTDRNSWPFLGGFFKNDPGVLVLTISFIELGKFHPQSVQLSEPAILAG